MTLLGKTTEDALERYAYGWNLKVSGNMPSLRWQRTEKENYA